MRSVVALRHVAFEDLGSFRGVLEAQGFKVGYRDAALDDLGAVDPLEPDMLVVLGGPIGAYEDDIYPFLRHELRVIEKRLAADRPTLGICLGSQLMARVLGARVYPGPRKEIGWSPLILSDEGRQSCLAPLAPELTSVLHWHGDTFDLPSGALCLASTADYANQAFAFGRAALALQFHAEATAAGLERWFIGHACEIAAADGVSVPQLRADTQRHGEALERQGAACLTRWLAELEA